MEFLNLLLQFATLTLLALIVVLNIREGRSVTQRVIMSGLAISTAAYVVSFSSESIQVSDLTRRIALFIHTPNIAFVWLFGLVLFDDEFQFRPAHIILSLLYIIPGIFICVVYPHSLFTEPRLSQIILSLYGLLLIGHLVYKLAADYKDDLINSRRRARLFFVGALVLVSIVMSFAEINMLPLPPRILAWFKISAMFVMALWVVLWVTRLDLNALHFRPQTAPSPPALDTRPEAALDDPRDEALKLSLIEIMEMQQAYAEQGLTIRALADKVGAPEHRLRHIINKGLGYRNFSAFLNSYRIKAIKTALKDPEKARLPILTLAMDYGYNSLAPFNRAFRESEGMTPSEYRHALESSS